MGLLTGEEQDLSKTSALKRQQHMSEDFQMGAIAATRAMRSVFPATPLLKNEHLSERYGADIYLKREDLSPVRSYKLRGAFNAMRKLIPEHQRFCLRFCG